MEERSLTPSSNILGVDIGTTSVKATVLDVETAEIVASASNETKSATSSVLSSLGNEQNVQQICNALIACIDSLPKSVLNNVRKIGICGQMHGVVLWKSDCTWNEVTRGCTEKYVSNLMTWQDGRCTVEFLSTMPPPHSHLSVSTGYGCATLLWLEKHASHFLRQYNRAGTIQDFIVAMICGLNKPLMSIQNAASWGYFDTVAARWNYDILKQVEFPIEFLPDIVNERSLAGQLDSSWLGIPKDTPVMIAFGDMQCSVYSILQDTNSAVLNISTSAQLSFLMPEDFVPMYSHSNQPIQYFPYFNGRYLAVAASLNGGNILKIFVETLQQWLHALGVVLPENIVWERFLAMAEDDSEETDLKIIPTLFGERHLPIQKASVSNISCQNISLGSVSHALCKSIVENIHTMLPTATLKAFNVPNILGVGTALKKNAALKKAVATRYELPVVFTDDRDAAFGVALFILKNM